MNGIRLLVLLGILLFTARLSEANDPSGVDPGPLEVFNQRILPIFRSPSPSSCVQCHLASVDLKNYILPSHEDTFVSLRDQGLINLDHPRKSKILTLIEMGDRDLDVGAKMIHEETRRAEYEAFASWIESCCSDSRLRGLPRLSEEQLAKPESPDAVIRHARKSRVVDSFVRNVWSQRMRCFPCHTPFEIDNANPRQQAAVKKHLELEAKFPELVERMRIFQETPEKTLQHLIERSRRTTDGEFPLINLDDPNKSLLILKPLSKLPAKDGQDGFEPVSYKDPVTHMGGLKMHRNDQSFKSFTAWLQDYANVVKGRYTSVADLPQDNWSATKLVLRLSAVPEEWPVGTPVQFFVHAKSDSADGWKSEPAAFAQGVVTPRRFVNGGVFTLAANSDGQATDGEEVAGASPSLPQGAYLIKVCVDLHGRIAADPTILLGDEDFAGQVALKKARWREGFRHAEKISGKKLVVEAAESAGP